MQKENYHNYLQLGTPARQQQSQTGRSIQATIPLQSQLNNHQYYQEYLKIHNTSLHFASQLKSVNQDKDSLWNRLTALQKKTEHDFKDQIRGESPQRKRRQRRNAEQIDKNYVCHVDKCMRKYGTEGSLNQHLKLKHPELYSEQQRISRQNSRQSQYEE